MNILFISYFFKPFDGVGAKRLTYWHENLPQNYTSKVITATIQEKTNKNIIYIRPVKSNTIISTFIKDEGLNWLKPLKKHFIKNKEYFKYDKVIITGGPFMHMLISKFLKRNFNVEVILDFRDPFYGNPRFKNYFFKELIKLHFQNKFLKHADKIITVNKYCANLIKGNNISIIDNGFDENEINNITDIQFNNKILLNLIAVGRIDSDFDMIPFLKIIEELKNTFFHYIGTSLPKINSSESLINYGKQSYNKTLSYINKSDICILFTGGEPFESTTKIFDFLAFNKKILIITQGKIKNGSLYDITKDYPNICWSLNNAVDIKNNIENLKNKELKIIDTYKFSRAYSLEKFIKVINL